MLCTGGKVVFVLVCDFDVILCGKNGGDYVMVIFTLVVLIWEILCVASRFFICGKYLFA